MSAGYPAQVPAVDHRSFCGEHRHDHHHLAHSHLHAHGIDGPADSFHGHQHSEAAPEPGSSDVLQIPGALGYGAGAGTGGSAAAKIDRITGDARNADMFSGGRIKGRTYVDANGGWDDDEGDSTERNPGHSDRNQPRRGGELHSDVERYLDMQREMTAPPAPRTEVANYKAKRLFGSVGREGRAVPWKGPKGQSMSAPSVGGAAIMQRPPR